MNHTCSVFNHHLHLVFKVNARVTPSPRFEVLFSAVAWHFTESGQHNENALYHYGLCVYVCAHVFTGWASVKLSSAHVLLCSMAGAVEAAVDRLQLRLFLQTLSLFLPQLLQRSNPFPTYAAHTQRNTWCLLRLQMHKESKSHCIKKKKQLPYKTLAFVKT